MAAWVLLLCTLQSEPDALGLVGQLGSPRYAEREAAGVALQHLGRAALAALQEGLKSRDAEVATRAAALVDQIETKLLIEPTLVKLDAQNQPASQVIEDLRQQTGIPLGFSQESDPRISQHMVTLKAAEAVPFWEAIERLCREVPCQVSLSNSATVFGQPGNPQPSVQLVTVRAGRVPSSVSGPFRTAVFSIHHARDRVFFAGMPGQMVLNQGFAGGNVQPARAADGGGNTFPLAGELQEQFNVGLQFMAEPRLSITPIGSLRISVAVDELGHSLVGPTESNLPQATTGMNPFGAMGGWQLIVPASLSLPQEHGKVIKRLKGELPVVVTSRRGTPFSVRLADAKSKAIEGAGLSVLVNEIKSAPNSFVSIDMTVKAKGADQNNGTPNPYGPEFAIFRNNGGQAQSQIEFVDTQGRVFTQWYTFNPQPSPEGLRLTIRLMPGEGLGAPAELRYYELSRAETQILFDISDIAMP